MLQQSEEWHMARLGRVTASRLSDVMARTKTGFGASRETYKTELLVEMCTNKPTEHFVNSYMEWGIENEPQARDRYQFINDCEVTETGFVVHPECDQFGASPDGLVGDDGLIEIKCPMTKTHIQTILTKKIPRKYMLQMQGQMMCTGRKWCDFVSFDPRVTGDMQIYMQRVEFCQDTADMIGKDVWEFICDLNNDHRELLEYQINGTA